MTLVLYEESGCWCSICKWWIGIC